MNSNKYLPKYQEIAQRLNISIVPGSICEVLPPLESSHVGTDHNDKFGNIAYFIAAGSGEIVGRYQKKNLWLTERHHLASCGIEPHRAFETPWQYPDGRPVKAGMLICWDLAFPEAFRALIGEGADIIIIPSCWQLSDVNEEALKLNPQSEKVFLESVTVARAFENEAAIVFCNSAGMSSIVMPHQGCLEKAQFGEEKMLVSEIDLGILGLAEENYSIKTDMKDVDWVYAHTMQKDAWGKS